jgi:hypothetical protein
MKAPSDSQPNYTVADGGFHSFRRSGIPRRIDWDAEYFPIEDGKKLRKKLRHK